MPVVCVETYEQATYFSAAVQAMQPHARCCGRRATACQAPVLLSDSRCTLPGMQVLSLPPAGAGVGGVCQGGCQLRHQCSKGEGG